MVRSAMLIFRAIFARLGLPGGYFIAIAAPFAMPVA